MLKNCNFSLVFTLLFAENEVDNRREIDLTQDHKIEPKQLE